MEASQCWAAIRLTEAENSSVNSEQKRLKKLVYAVHFKHNLGWKVGWTNGQGDKARSERKQPQSAQAGHPTFHILSHDLRYELPNHLIFTPKKYEMKADRNAEQDLVRPAKNR